MEEENAQVASKIIADNIHCVVATMNTQEMKPWISPLRFEYDEMYNLYWVTAKDSLHSTYIKQNNNVAVVIFNSNIPEGTGNGVYIEGKTQEISSLENISKAIRVYFQNDKKFQPAPEEYTQEKPRRVYKTTIEKVWILQEPVVIKGQSVDLRVEIPLIELQNAFQKRKHPAK